MPEHTATQRERGQADKKQKGSKSHGMQKRRTAAGSKESMCIAWRTPKAAPLKQHP
jgi:hypothetical protein